MTEPNPAVFVFDAYGTLFDVHAAIARYRAIAGPDADRFSETWRTKQLEYAWTLTLAGRYTILVVTHNMAQARRVSQECAFMLMGEVIEHDRTENLFLTPKDARTADYVEGRYG